MKNIILLFLTLSTLSLAYENSLTKSERKALGKKFKLYNMRYQNRAFTLKNIMGKREIVIDRKLRDLPTTSKTAFGDYKYSSAYDWEMTTERNGIQYFAVKGTTRRKAIAKIDGRYVVFFYNAVGKNKDLVDDTIDDVRKVLVNN